MKCQYLQWFGWGNQDPCKLSHDARIRRFAEFAEIESTVFASDQNFFYGIDCNIDFYASFSLWGCVHYYFFFLLEEMNQKCEKK